MFEDEKILVTSPLLPKLEELNELMADIWNRKWITNAGYYHQLLEEELAKYLNEAPELGDEDEEKPKKKDKDKKKDKKDKKKKKYHSDI